MKFIINGLVVLALLALCAEMLPHRGGGGSHSGGHAGYRSGGGFHNGGRVYGGGHSWRGSRFGRVRGNWWGSYNWLDPLYFSYAVYSTWSIAELDRRIAELEDALRDRDMQDRENYQRALDQLKEERAQRA